MGHPWKGCAFEPGPRCPDPSGEGHVERGPGSRSGRIRACEAMDSRGRIPDSRSTRSPWISEIRDLESEIRKTRWPCLHEVSALAAKGAQLSTAIDTTAGELLKKKTRKDSRTPGSGEANAIVLQAGFERDVPDRIDPGCEVARGPIKESAGRPSPSPDATAHDYCFLEG